jgi:hypothetical protein
MAANVTGGAGAGKERVGIQYHPETGGAVRGPEGRRGYSAWVPQTGPVRAIN